MQRRVRAGLNVSLWMMVGLGAPLGCASTIEGAPGGQDAGITADGGARADGSSNPDVVGSGACVEWVLTDQENSYRGESHTDDHLTFDAAGQLQRRYGHIRTGGHGIDRTYRELSYQWSADRLVVRQVAPSETSVTYTLDGSNVVQRVVASAIVGQSQTVRYTRDGAGRVVERLETRESPATETRCRYTYDPAGHLLESNCSDGALEQYRWEGDLPVRSDRSWRGRYPGFAIWQWSATGTLLSERHDDGYGPGRGYRRDHTWDAQGRLVRTDDSNDTNPTPRTTAAFAYDARGRLVREERSFDEAGVARSVVLWERDAEGRIARRIAGDTGVASNYTYTVTPTQIEVSMVVGESRTERRYRCFASPVRLVPEDPLIGVPIPSTNPTVEEYPQARELP